jgi:hypothetical protein
MDTALGTQHSFLLEPDHVLFPEFPPLSPAHHTVSLYQNLWEPAGGMLKWQSTCLASTELSSNPSIVNKQTHTQTSILTLDYCALTVVHQWVTHLMSRLLLRLRFQHTHRKCYDTV